MHQKIEQGERTYTAEQCTVIHITSTEKQQEYEIQMNDFKAYIPQENNFMALNYNNATGGQGHWAQ